MTLAAYGLHAFPPAASLADTTVLQLDAAYNRANREVLITGFELMPIEVGALYYSIYTKTFDSYVQHWQSQHAVQRVALMRCMIG
jgi:hypothetical protein